MVETNTVSSYLSINAKAAGNDSAMRTLGKSAMLRRRYSKASGNL